MANYYSTSRTNYFRVKDNDAFNKWAEQFDGIEIIEKDGTVGLLFDDGMPTIRLVTQKEENGDEEDVEVEIDFMDELAEHLADEEVAIFQEAGAEKMRYVSGHAIAINNKKDVRGVTLDDIYTLAKELGKNVSRAEY